MKLLLNIQLEWQQLQASIKIQKSDQLNALSLGTAVQVNSSYLATVIINYILLCEQQLYICRREANICCGSNWKHHGSVKVKFLKNRKNVAVEFESIGILSR